MDLPPYPIKFKPILKEKVWGGTKLKDLLNKETTSDIVGESWEISGVDGSVSIVENGPLKGKSLQEIIQIHKERLVGESVYNKFGNQFPLLFKFIDAREDLSVQLHPDDALAKKRHNSFGKTEMWYIVQADEGAELIMGFNTSIDKGKYQKHLEENTLEKILHREKIKKGDAFYITPGTIHAIGAGTLLAEIQQTSDITYRVYDWNRPDTDGKPRELHTDLALDAIDFESKNHKLVTHINNPEFLIHSPYFSTSVITVQENSSSRDFSKIDSFVVYMCVEGSILLKIANNSVNLSIGETVLIPACAKEVHFQDGSAKLLQVFVP
tara:strand:+ start:5580 stop:6551 length:972 start_codon:yes stop_codon:yes gene_type:complete